MLHVHRSERADGLVDALGVLLAAPAEDPFAAEVVSVPTRGMERWLAQRLSARLGTTPGRGDGVCANVDFPSPHRLVTDLIATASGVDPDADPWLPERSVWPLLDVVDEALGEPWLAELSAHLGADPGDDDALQARRTRRLTTVRHLAGLYHRYALHRPGMVRAWAGGSDADGDGGALPEDARWQAELWRRLRARIGSAGPAERLDAACARLVADPSVSALPARIALFGLTRLPAGHLHVLQALAAARDVHLLLLHPSPAMWESVAGTLGADPPPRHRRDDMTAELPGSRLLASWGRDSREMQLVLAAANGHVDHHHPAHARSGSLLARIQDDLHANRPPPGAPPVGGADQRMTLDPADRSIELHACHGRARQVEVLRDAILHALKDDSTLEPRDVIVLCPDIEAFAPLIQATFGAGRPAGDEQDGAVAAGRAPDLRVRLADRALRQTNPVLGVVAELLELAGTRITASQVLDLADREPVRRRFRFDDEDLGRLQGWVSDGGIRWGLDAEHRAPFKLEAYRGGTWRFGLDRLLLGVTMTEDRRRLWQDVLPIDNVESGVIDLVGRFSELLARLTRAVDSFATPKPILAWAQDLADAADTLTATADRDAWQRAELQRLLETLAGEASEGEGGDVNATPLALPEVRSLLADRLEGRPTRANFRTGSLTVCTLVPMRSVPHRIVCLLGLDDDVFPRKGNQDGDDLMLRDPRVGERDQRSEDRQLLLDAVLAATERLIITFTGNDERTNAARSPAVPIGELLETIDATTRTPNGPARSTVLIRHPLQPFDRRNFTAGKLGRAGSWGFDPVMRDGAGALAGMRSPRAPFLPGPLPVVDDAVVELENVLRFVQHPARAFLRRRLGIGVVDYIDEIEDALRVELDGLQRWGVGQRLVDARLQGSSFRDAALAEIARGHLPPGVLGQPVITDVHPLVETIAAQTLGALEGQPPAGSVDVRVPLPDGRSLRGTVAGVSGSVVWSASYSRVSPKHRLATWLRLLALTAAHPEREYTAVTVGRAGGDRVRVVRLGALGPDEASRGSEALAQLTALIDLHERGMREPLPIYCATSAAYAEAAAGRQDAVKAASGEWTTEYDYDKEDREPEHVLVLDGVRPFADLLAAPPRSDELGDGWDPTETTRFGRLAVRLWSGLLAHEGAAA